MEKFVLSLHANLLFAQYMKVWHCELPVVAEEDRSPSADHLCCPL